MIPSPGVATTEQIEEWVREHEADMWIRKQGIRDAVAWFRKDTGLAVTQSAFKAAAEGHCCFWRQVRRKPLHKTGLLTSEEWDMVRETVRLYSRVLRGRTLSEAVEIVRSRCRVNRDILQGLPARLRFWEHEEEVAA